MSLSSFTENVNVISALPDDPLDSGGYTTETVKAAFDAAAGKIKTWINGTLVDYINKISSGVNLGNLSIDTRHIKDGAVTLAKTSGVQASIKRAFVTVQSSEWTSITNGACVEVEVPYSIYTGYASATYIVRPATESGATAENVVLNYKGAAGRQFFPYGHQTSDGKYYFDLYCVGSVPTRDLYLEIIKIPL